MIIGIDHGYGLIKTKNSVFVSGVKKYNFEPAVLNDVVQYNDLYYVIGGNRQTVKDNKICDEKH